MIAREQICNRKKIVNLIIEYTEHHLFVIHAIQWIEWKKNAFEFERFHVFVSYKFGIPPSYARQGFYFSIRLNYNLLAACYGRVMHF